MRINNTHNCVLFQVPPLTPGTNFKLGEVLRNTYTGWSACSLQSGVPADPRDWSLSDVKEWLRWTMVEFSLASDAFHRFIEDFKVSTVIKYY